MSVRPSVRLSRRSTAVAAGLLLRSGAGGAYRSLAAAAARHAGRVNFVPTITRSNILVLIVYVTGKKVKGKCSPYSTAQRRIP